jgi:hypothetical protein
LAPTPDSIRRSKRQPKKRSPRRSEAESIFLLGAKSSLMALQQTIPLFDHLVGPREPQMTFAVIHWLS